MVWHIKAVHAEYRSGCCVGRYAHGVNDSTKPDTRFWDIMDKSKLVVITQVRSDGYPSVTNHANASTSAIIKHIIDTERDA